MYTSRTRPQTDPCGAVCGIRRELGEEKVKTTMDIAGNYELSGSYLEPKLERLKTASAHADSQREGVRIELHGGHFNQRKQGAIIEFLCTKEGPTERRRGNEEGDDKKDNDTEDPSKGGEEVDDGKGGKLKFVSYGPKAEDSPEDVLRLTWITKYACENVTSEPGEKTGTHWGFFTWIFVM